MIILDTNVISELMRPRPDPAVRSWVQDQDGSETFTTAITVAELQYGVARMPRGQRRNALEHAVEELLEDFDDRILPFDTSAARRYGALAAASEAAGQPVAMADAQIAAIVVEENATLATRNVTDFEGLVETIVNPWDP